MEQEIHMHIIRVEKVFCGSSPTHFRRTALELQKRMEFAHPFNKKRKMACRDGLKIS
jgi:hypothetical protein